MRKLHLINYSEDVTVLHGKPRQYRVNIMTFLYLKTFYIYSRRLSRSQMLKSRYVQI